MNGERAPAGAVTHFGAARQGQRAGESPAGSGRDGRTGSSTSVPRPGRNRAAGVERLEGERRTASRHLGVPESTGDASPSPEGPYAEPNFSDIARSRGKVGARQTRSTERLVNGRGARFVFVLRRGGTAGVEQPGTSSAGAAIPRAKGERFGAHRRRGRVAEVARLTGGGVRPLPMLRQRRRQGPHRRVARGTGSRAAGATRTSVRRAPARKLPRSTDRQMKSMVQAGEALRRLAGRDHWLQASPKGSADPGGGTDGLRPGRHADRDRRGRPRPAGWEADGTTRCFGTGNRPRRKTLQPERTVARTRRGERVSARTSGPAAATGVGAIGAAARTGPLPRASARGRRQVRRAAPPLGAVASGR
jgi:hypothetical protein